MTHTTEVARPTVRDQASKTRILLVVFAATFLITSLLGIWPEIFAFSVQVGDSPIAKLLHSPMHAADDVMISLRSGAMLREIGLPAFNRHDLAQASTSYASPYVFAMLLGVLPGNLAVGAYALLGMLAVALTLCTVVWFSKSPSNALLLALGLLLTRTNLIYGFTGWDHLFQAFFLTLATCISLRKSVGPLALFTASLSLGLACIFRPDGVIIALAVLWALFLRRGSMARFVSLGLLPIASILVGMLWLNEVQFGTLTPTTARLKLGAAPSAVYALRYFFENAALSFTALAMLLAMIGLYGVFRDRWSRRMEAPIVGACVITTAIAMVNSDVFSGARMVWAPACVMAALTAMSAPAWFDIEAWSKRIAHRLLDPLNAHVQQRLPSFGGAVFRTTGIMLLCLVLGGSLASALRAKWRQAVISPQAVTTSRTAQQYRLAQWIEAHLQPSEGPIGMFYLGISYHMPRFEAADFLGKADEMIATSPVKWGPPGHNKWDIERTLSKWRPQAIIPTEQSDPHMPKLVSAARQALSAHRDYGFAPALLLSEQVSRDFAYCYLTVSQDTASDQWGFFLRKDLVARHTNSLHCT